METLMLRKTFLALAAAASIGLLVPGTASARGGHGGGGGGWHGGGGGWHGGWRGGGWGWGFGGLAAGAAIGYGLYGPYGYYGYGYPYYGGGYYDGYYGDEGGGNCYIVRRRVHTANGWRVRRVEMCD
jgi:hypothetical protein